MSLPGPEMGKEPQMPAGCASESTHAQMPHIVKQINNEITACSLLQKCWDALATHRHPNPQLWHHARQAALRWALKVALATRQSCNKVWEWVAAP